MQVYDTVTDSWSTKPTTFVPHEASAAITYGDRLYFFAGSPDSRGAADATTTVSIYSPIDDTWSTGPSMAVPKHYAAAALFEGALHVLGGFDKPAPALGRSDHEIFLPNGYGL